MFTGQQTQFIEFMKEQHGDQVRKYTGEPYWTHPVAVAKIVQAFALEQDREFCLTEIAIGHDLIEDTDCTFDDINRVLYESGYSVGDLLTIQKGIFHLTDQYDKEAEPDLNRAARKKLESERLGTIPAQFQTVKYADLIHNSGSILQYDENFARTYIEEKIRILEVMNKGNETLYNIAKAIANQYNYDLMYENN